MVRSLFVVLLLGAASVQASCPPASHGSRQLAALKAAEFALADAAERQSLALALLPCLAHADPTLRDGIAFEALSHWLRADALDQATRAQLLQQLLVMVEPEAGEGDGFVKPFAVLVLSEVARTDRVAAWMSDEQRAALVDAAVVYLEGVHDYRGFETGEGWRHGVAHGSDLALQLVLNEAVGKAQIDNLLHSIDRQIAPAGEHAYIHGESERLARPVLYAALRELHSDEEWAQWFKALHSPAPLSAWQDSFASRAGLALRHNRLAFLQAVYVNSRDSSNPALSRLAPMALAAIKAMQ